ncbi:flagellar biosynthesis repressor FlbT [Rhodospirillum rubrum]|uniref:flagellar biosynthesis repressor FlbT n=1 Tax=Rhodospirillum rubrum TaxID=1085 RepID=UPI0019083FBF|nr:flagellar biosynthesis repressor FlbT [Rhodospirillum rubrum]MBK1665947.1 flagellar biosynthesis repressor FlbT [Rhodospirillum rubrum]MBK1677332.1 flagellar biosynthesis repressor FlbT [Rhodospirillum rubrum]
MPLKVTLKPNEKILVGTAVIANGPNKAELVILNRVPVLRQKDIVTEDQADTVAKKLYFAILNMYVAPERERDFHNLYFLLLRQLILLPLEPRAIDLMHEVSECIISGDHYRALKVCRKLIDYEAEVLRHGEGSDPGLSAKPEVDPHTP